MKYLHNDTMIEAADAAGIVDQMRAGSFQVSRDVHEYMDQVASRITDQMGKPIRTDTAEGFVEDLVGVGILEPARE